MYWEMIKYSIENGMNFFSFGRSTKGSGTHEFKSRWGALEQQLYFNNSEYSFDIRKLKILSYLWSKLPYTVVKKLGSLHKKTHKNIKTVHFKKTLVISKKNRIHEPMDNVKLNNYNNQDYYMTNKFCLIYK